MPPDRTTDKYNVVRIHILYPVLNGRSRIGVALGQGDLGAGCIFGREWIYGHNLKFAE